MRVIVSLAGVYVKRAIGMTAVLALAPCMARAHGFARYVSTPVTPLQEFVWWLPISASILVLGVAAVLRYKMGRHGLVALGLALVATTLFAVVFFMWGRHTAYAITAPLPGLDVPHPTFWGMGWRRAGWVFISWNLRGYLVLLCAVCLCGGVRRIKRQFAEIALLVAAIYVCGLIPYISTGALVHGWAGGHVHGECQKRIMKINAALVAYAHHHNGCMPVADDMKTLVASVQPYLSHEDVGCSEGMYVCPEEEAFTRNPHTFTWNAAFSGAALREIDPDQIWEGNVPISCPRHTGKADMAAIMLIGQLCQTNGTPCP